ELYRQRFFLQPRTEAGLHWRATILRLAKWPFVLLASLEAIFNVKLTYAITRKVGRSRAPWGLAVAHLGTALVVVAAWAAGGLPRVGRQGSQAAATRVARGSAPAPGPSCKPARRPPTARRARRPGRGEPGFEHPSAYPAPPTGRP